jgi:hypothetical protein
MKTQKPPKTAPALPNRPFELTRREYFSGLALQAFADRFLDAQLIAKISVRYADELIKELDSTTEDNGAK